MPGAMNPLEVMPPPSPRPRCHPGLRQGWPAGAAWDASRDASPPRPRASAFSREPAKPAATPGRGGQAARGAARGRPAPGPPAWRRRPRHPAEVASPFVSGFRGGCEQAGRVNRPVVPPGVGTARDEPHESASGQRMGSFMPGKGLSHAGQGDKGTRAATAATGSGSLAPTAVLGVAPVALGDRPPAWLAPPLAHGVPCQRPEVPGARER